MYKAKLLGNTEADGANGILRNTGIVVECKYLSNLDIARMILINCKRELKLKWTKHCVLASAGSENGDANSDNTVSTIKGTHCISVLSLYQQKIIKNWQNFLPKDLKDQCIETSLKQKGRVKIRQTSIDIFSNQTL